MLEAQGQDLLLPDANSLQSILQQAWQQKINAHATDMQESEEQQRVRETFSDKRLSD